MSGDPLARLFHPLDAGLIDWPDDGSPVLFIGAVAGARLPRSKDRHLQLVQGFRPDYLALIADGHIVTPRVPAGTFALSLVLAGRHRGQNELGIADALEITADGGRIIVAGAKEDGIASLCRRIGRLIDIEAQAPKHHGVALWFRRPADALAISAILRDENPTVLVEGRFRTAPGMFSHGEVDKGSRLMEAHLPKDLAGRAADFCSGWGFIAAAAIGRCPGLTTIDLYEADFESIEAAKTNLADAEMPLRFFWHDLLSEPVAERYDVILMNPPFHRGRAGEPSIGQGMIRAAAAALRKSGRLLLVANRQLPYEDVLATTFGRVTRLAEDGAFKVIEAVR